MLDSASPYPPPGSRNIDPFDTTPTSEDAAPTSSTTTQPLRAQAQRHQLPAAYLDQPSGSYRDSVSHDLTHYPSSQDIHPANPSHLFGLSQTPDRSRASLPQPFPPPLQRNQARSGRTAQLRGWSADAFGFIDRYIRSHWNDSDASIHTNEFRRGGSYDLITDMQAASGQQQPDQTAGSGQPHRESLYRQLRWSSSHEPVTRKRKLQLLRSYLPDWIITFVLTGLLAIINKAYGFRREFSLTDTSIQHTHAVHERVPTWLLFVLAVLIPAIMIAVISLGVSRSVWDLHNGLLGFVLANALTVTITTIIKVTVGRPRPDLIDRCQPMAGSINASPYGLVTEAICTVPGSDSVLKDGFRSFPSGHSSTSWCGFTYLTLYLAAKMHLFDRRGHAITAWLCLVPLMAAALIAISRTMDYRHHATDVIAGGLLGILISYWIYRLYYPPLSHPQCHKPYSPRIPKEGIPSAHHRTYSTEEDSEYAAALPPNGNGAQNNYYPSSNSNGVDNSTAHRESLIIQDSHTSNNPAKDFGHSLDYPEQQTVPRE
ncbi:acid phosphatase/Vanadium-dependent haloperoxidase [Testicularia cyperi]|uniref:Acid phosphatase/Vanadium-dependent haloperoxidase n=1 Tax=Testicularia cyperi TaxID=1882483 RepID=A0A317XWK8_9BASI|nr:acid phosphatase/Vanadium-dependent haloperoxidase [Testicularia cyperi]